MHRSGTSLLGCLLQRLGLVLPGEIIAADQCSSESRLEWREVADIEWRWIIEWREVADIQQRLLIDLDRCGPAAQGAQAMPQQWMQHPATQVAKAQLNQLLGREALQQNAPWGFNDPRTSRLLPLWIALAQELNLPLRLLLAVRDPEQVVRSVQGRDSSIGAIDAIAVQQLWWRYNLEAIEAAQAAGLPMHVFDYRSWFAAPEQQLQALLPSIAELKPSAQQIQQALSLIKPKLCSGIGNVTDHDQALEPALPSALQQLYQQLLQSPLPTYWPSSEPPESLLVQPVANDPGPPPSWAAWCDQQPAQPAPLWHGTIDAAAELIISLWGSFWSDIEPHLLLQHLPLFSPLGLLDQHRSSNSQLRVKRQCGAAIGESLRIGLNLSLPPPESSELWLAELRAQDLIWDPDPVRVHLLRALGLPAWLLSPSLAVNSWLEQPLAKNPSAWAAQLGLTAVKSGSLLVLADAGPSWAKALAAESARQSNARQPQISYHPGWLQLVLSTPLSGLAAAGWLAAAARTSARLVHVGPGAETRTWAWLKDLKSEPITANVGLLPNELRKLHQGAASTRWRRAWYRAEEQLLLNAKEQLRLIKTSLRRPVLNSYATSLNAVDQIRAEDRCSPPAHELFLHHNDEPVVTVVVSLFNYADRIISTLNSVAAQTQAKLELIVVDDASTDRGEELVLRWMQQHRFRFARLQLLQHKLNAGLATARNTAFAAAYSSWCFVLDADNKLMPEAVQDCLAIAQQGDAQLAVVHPLIRVEAERGLHDDQNLLIGMASWQVEKFVDGNYIDAMALVRCSAWKDVGGYTHIAGGLEDFDFWCKLVEAGWHGQQCSKILATYCRHKNSMTAKETRHKVVELRSCVKARHPWLSTSLGKSISN